MSTNLERVKAPYKSVYIKLQKVFVLLLFVVIIFSYATPVQAFNPFTYLIDTLSSWLYPQSEVVIPTVPVTPPPPTARVVNPVTILGPAGAPGSRGIQGPQGPRGFTGSQGPMGPQGLPAVAGGAGNSLDPSIFVPRTFFDGQVNRIFDSIGNSTRGLADSLAKEVNTKLLMVSGNATVGGDLTITGNITGNISGILNGLTITGNGTNTLNIAAGKSLIVSNILTLAGTDNTTMTFPTTSATIARTDAGQIFAGNQNIASLIGNKIYPASDSTTAIQINKADGTTNVLNVDTTNGYVGIGTTNPSQLLTVGNNNQFTVSSLGNVSIGTTMLANGCPVLQDATNLCVKATPYYASGSAAITTTVGTTAVGTSVVLTSAASFSANQGIYIAGAGAGGDNYIGTISVVNGTTLTITPATQTQVSVGVMVQHDDSAAIQEAITALTSSGGVVVFPDGTYNVNGPLQDTGGANAILLLPSVPYINIPAIIPIGITLLGLTEPVLGGSSGAIIKTESSAGANLIAGYHADTGLGTFTYISLRLKNLLFRSYDDPNVTMVNGNNVVDLRTENVVIDTGFPPLCAAFFPTACPNTFPTHSASAGIITPAKNNAVESVNINLSVMGYYTGVLAQEHSNFDHLSIRFGVNCLTTHSEGAHPIYVGRLYTEVCTNHIHQPLDTPSIIIISEWSTEGGTIDDQGQLLGGVITYESSNTFTIAGGSNLKLTNLKTIAQQLFGNASWAPGVMFTATDSRIQADVVGQVMTITPLVGALGYPYYGYNTLVGDFTGKSLTVRALNVVQGATADQQFLLIDPSMNLVGLYYNNGILTLAVTSNMTTIASKVYSPTEDKYWRLREASGVIYADTSRDGATWTNLGSTTVAWPYTSGISAALIAGTHGSAANPGYAQFDQYNSGPTMTSGNELVITNVGNFGIGTAPVEKLDLGGALGITGGNIILGTYSATVSRYLGIGSGIAGSFAPNSGFSGIEFGPSTGPASGYLAFHTLDAGHSSDERMRIDKVGNVGIGTTGPLELLSLGTTGTKAGVLSLAGATTGKVIINTAADAGTWTMTLPTAVGGAGQQLTDVAGNGITSWAAAGSSRELKDIVGIITDPTEALAQILGTPIYRFHYKTGKGTGDTATEYVGVMADEAPWAMHYSGTVVNPVNTLGYMVLGLQATNKKIEDLNLNLDAVAGIVTPLAGSASESFVTALFNNIKTKISTWLADAGNGISNIFAGTITVHNANVDNLCVKKSDGTNVCITGDQLDSLLVGVSSSGSGSGSGSGGGAATCSDGIKNQDETGIDTGGVCVPAVTLQSIAITTPATKLSYTVGDTLDITDLVVTGIYSDITTKVETVTTSDVSGFVSTVPVTGQVLTITVGGKTATYTVDVVAVAQ